MKNFTPIVFCTALLLFAHSLKSQCSSPVALPYFNGFEGDSVGSPPTCLTIQNIYGTLSPEVYNQFVFQGSKSLAIKESPSDFYCDAWLFFPAMNFEAGKSYKLSFQYRGYNNFAVNEYPFQIYYGTTPNAASMTQSLGSTTFWPNTYTPFNVSFPVSVSNTYYIGIRYKTNYDEGNGLYIDNCSVTENVTPACTNTITGLTISTDGVNLTNATVKWQKPVETGLGDTYDWEIRTTADPGSGNQGLFAGGSTSDTFITLSGLNSGTRYTAYIRSKCGGVVPGNWSSIRLKTNSPEYATMALPITVAKYNGNLNTIGPISIPDFPDTRYNVWYSFIPQQEQLVFQFRRKFNITSSYHRFGLRRLLYDIYKALPNGSLGNIIASGGSEIVINYPGKLCYNGSCQSYNGDSPSAGDYPFVTLDSDQKYFISIRQADQSYYPPGIVQSFEAGIYNADIWAGIGSGASAATGNATLNGNKWNGIYNQYDYKMYAAIHPQGNSLGTINGNAVRQLGSVLRDAFGTKLLNRTFRITSTQNSNEFCKIRLYFTVEELQRFTDSTGKSFKDMRVTQNNDPIYNPLPPYGTDNYYTGGTQIIPDTGSYDVYKYLEFTTNKFGTFYIHGDSVRLPVITQHPSNKTVCPGTVVSLSSNAINGLPAPLIQWQQSTNGGTTWTNIVNAKSANYTFTQTEDKNGVMYRAAWSNTAGTIYSNSAIVRNVLVADLSAPCCAGGNIVAISNTGISAITWLYNNSPVTTQNFNYPANAITVVGGNGSGLAANQFTNPFSVATDTAGNIYVADAGNHRVQKFAPGSAIGTTVAGGNGAGAAANQFNNPRSVFVDAAGNLYIADAGNNRIQKWLANAVSGTTIAGGNGAGNAANQLDFPHGVFADGAGNVYVADGNNSRIQKFVPGSTDGITVAGGNGSGSAANQLNYATGVSVDTAGNVYANDFTNNRVQKWAPNAVTAVTVAGGNGAGNSANQLNSPRSIFVDCNNAVYVADQNNNRIQKWLPGATTGITIAGGNADGSNANQLSSPAAVFEDGKGNLLVADRLNQRIQQFSLPKTATYTINEGGAYKAIVTGTGCCSVNTQPVIINAANGPIICPGSSTYFVSQNSASGNTWQWQVNSGNGFVNIADNTIYNGATSDTLKLIVPSTAWYGYKFRSVINGTTYSPEYVLKFAVNWTGNSSTAWENTANWNCGVLPDENTDVIINAGLANYPLVNVNSVCGSLKLMPGTAVTVKTGIKLDVKRK